MKTLKRRKSRRTRAAAVLGDIKAKAPSSTEIVKASKKAPVKPIAIIGAITAAAAGFFVVRRRGSAAPAA